jgi:hypothetical protein
LDDFKEGRVFNPAFKTAGFSAAFAEIDFEDVLQKLTV